MRRRLLILRGIGAAGSAAVGLHKYAADALVVVVVGRGGGGGGGGCCLGLAHTHGASRLLEGVAKRVIQEEEEKVPMLLLLLFHAVDADVAVVVGSSRRGRRNTASTNKKAIVVRAMPRNRTKGSLLKVSLESESSLLELTVAL